MSIAERNQELTSSSSQIESLTTLIDKLEKDMNRAKAIHDFQLCTKLYNEKRKMIVEQNKLKKKYNHLLKKEQKHKWYQEKKSDDCRSKASSSECENVLHRDIRHFMQKKPDDSNISNTKIVKAINRPGSDDMLILDSSTSEEERNGSNDRGSLDGRVLELKKKIQTASNEIVYVTEQLAAGNESEDIKKKSKIDVVKHHEEEDMKCLEHHNSSIVNGEEIVCLRLADPVHTDVKAGSNHLDDENASLFDYFSEIWDV